MHSQNNNGLLTQANQWLKNHLPFVIYRYPNETTLRGVFQENDNLNSVCDLDHKGFVFMPFDPNKYGVLIKGNYKEEKYAPSKFKIKHVDLDFLNGNRQHHISLVNKTIREIKGGNLKKVVLSRSIHAKTNKPNSELMESLLTKYQNAFCYWWYHPKIGMWFGATPEQLLQYQNKSILTCSLAGTLPYIQNKEPNWTSKEREEQQMVTDFIKDCLSEEVDNVLISTAKSFQAGSLWHLKSVIKGELKSTSSLSKMVRVLHPTPAVCGLPREQAFNFILENEDYDRKYYTGYLGPVNLEKDESANLFVNLRCFKYSSSEAQIFVGGGITASSDAKKEWEETQFKSRTILDVL